MTKISSKTAYPKKKPISSDYFVGTDSEDFNKTVNFGFEEVAGLVNDLNGTPILNYVFSTSPYLSTEVLLEGRFLSDENELSTPLLTKLYVNKFNNSGDNLQELYLFLQTNATDFYLKLRNSNNQNNTVYFDIASIQDFSDYFVLNIVVFKENEFLPLLQNLNVYFFDFELKATSAGTSDPLKLDKAGYTGNAENLDDRIIALESLQNLSTNFIGQAYAIWTGEGLIYDVIYPNYYIEGVPYLGATEQITLDAADLTNPRQDVIAVDATGAIKKIGIASPDPAAPSVDTQTEIYISTIFIGAGATTPTGVSNTDVYKENIEFVTSTNLGTVNFNSTTFPFSGTKCIDIGAFTPSKYLRFSGVDSLEISDFSTLQLFLYLKASFATTAKLSFRFINGTTPVSSIVLLNNGLFNYNRTVIQVYQNIVIPISAFTFSSGTFTGIEIFTEGSNGSGCKIDNISLQKGGAYSSPKQKALTSIITDSGVANATTEDDAFTLRGGNGAIVSASGKVITITPTTPTKSQIGLGNVDNTSDANKPVSTAQQAYLDLKLDASSYNQHFKGVYLTEAALIAAHPTGVAGDTAQVNEVGATDVINYSWDAEESIWVNNGTGGSGAVNTDALPEGTTNLYWTVSRFLANLTYANVIAALGFTPSTAPNDAQKNSNITKAEIEAKLTGEITTHTHPEVGGGEEFIVPEILGNIYAKTTWGDVLDFTTSGTTAISLNGDKLNLTSSGTGSFSDMVKLNNKISLLERWNIKAKIKVTSNTATSYGIGFGIRSVNTYGSPSLIGRFTTQPTGNLLIINNGEANGQVASVSTFNLAINDIVEFELDYKDGFVTLSLKKGVTIAQTTYQYSLYSTSPFLPNTGQFVATVFGASAEIQELNISSGTFKQADLMIIGDSKLQGYNTTGFQKTVAALLRKKYPIVINSAGGYDRTIEGVSRLAELKSLLPKNVVLHLGSNDKRSGVSFADWSTRFMQIKTEMESVGAVVFAMKMFNENILDFSDYNDFITANFPVNRTIDIGILSDLADGVHPGDVHQSIIADAIYTKVGFVKQTTLTEGNNIKIDYTNPFFPIINAIIEPDDANLVLKKNYLEDVEFVLVNSYSINLAAINKTTVMVDNTGSGTMSVIVPTNSAVPLPVGTKKVFINAAPIHSFVISGAGVTFKTNVYTFAPNESAVLTKTATDTWSISAITTLPAHFEYLVSNKTIWNNGQGNIDTNISFGRLALAGNSSGNNNTALGFGASQISTTQSNNTAIGSEAMRYANGNANVAVGAAAVPQTSGNSNVGVGNFSLNGCIASNFNVAIGHQSLLSLVNSQHNNAAVGYQTGYSLTTCLENVFFGYRAGYFKNDDTVLLSATNSVFLGTLSKSKNEGDTNQIVIGHSAQGNGSNTVTLGNNSMVRTFLKGVVNQGKAYTVSTLPTGVLGDRTIVTDAVSPTYLGALTGGGSVVCPVFFNGTSWVSN